MHFYALYIRFKVKKYSNILKIINYIKDKKRFFKMTVSQINTQNKTINKTN